MKSNLFLSTSAAATFRMVAIILVLALCTVTMVPSAWSQEPVPAPSGESTEGGNASSAGMQAASVFSTILYAPFKVAFAIGGGIVGGLAYAFSGGNENAARSIWTTSLYGTYLITPDHLRGDRPIRFLGVAEPDTAAAQVTPPVTEPVR
ncbi:MAG TPA: hypothetical protein VGR71_15495 [Nitrospira sp.]|nr:hypothetical protein [Nitrospira sp.]